MNSSIRDKTITGTSVLAQSVCVEGGRPAYSPPRLVSLGDVRDLTLGGSPGFSDSSPQPENQPT
jgi:hypothetical protein